MTKEVHFILQGKGGVGKSLVARLLVEYFIFQEIKYTGYDADAVNQSLAAVEDYNVEVVQLLDGGEVDPRRFDTVISSIEDQKDRVFVIDCGASSFLPIMGYIENAEVIETLSEAGYEVFVHTVVTAGPSKSDTFAGYNKLREKFGSECNVVVWTNPIFGDVTEGNTPFVETDPVVKAIADETLLGVIQIPKLPRMNQQDFSEFLEANVSFATATAKTNKDINSMVRRRISKIHSQLMSQISYVMADDSEAEDEGVDT